MNKQECEKLVERYVEWFRKSLSVDLPLPPPGQSEKACLISTPFVEANGDHLQVYVLRRDGKIIITDDGHVTFEVRTRRTDFDTPEFQNRFEAILKASHIQRDGQDLLVEVSEEDFGQRLHDFLHAMLYIVDLFTISRT